MDGEIWKEGHEGNQREVRDYSCEEYLQSITIKETLHIEYSLNFDENPQYEISCYRILEFVYIDVSL
jgi:hypothetical protein